MVRDSVERLHLAHDYGTRIPLDLTALGAILELVPRLQSFTVAVEALECRSVLMGTLLPNSSPVHLDLLELKGALRCTSASLRSLLSQFASVSQIVLVNIELHEVEDLNVEPYHNQTSSSPSNPFTLTYRWDGHTSNGFIAFSPCLTPAPSRT